MMINVNFTRGEIVKCGTCPQLGIVIRKDQLPQGWQVFIETSKTRELTARLICPACNAAETERWNPRG
jgi:hypothetical protein